MNKFIRSVVDLAKNRKADLITFDQDPLTKSINLERHCFGEFSMANVQANENIEDQSQVEVASQNALYLGVYDGHGGDNASLYVLNNLFPNLLRFAQANDNTITEQTLKDSVLDTENGFMGYVEHNIGQIQPLGEIGTCCLAGALWKGVLYVANLGDSRAVIGSVVNKRIVPTQLTTDHNCNDPAIRQELQAMHPGDPTIVMNDQDGWRVKGILAVSRCIGDAYLKRPAFSLLPSFPQYAYIPPPFDTSVLSAEPEMVSRAIADNDRFLIFASDGLWELMSNKKAVKIVHNYPRNGIAKRLLATALAKAAKRRQVTYRAMIARPPGYTDINGRRNFHDDISVIVVFLDKAPLIREQIDNLSYRGSADGSQPSGFQMSGLTAATE